MSTRRSILQNPSPSSHNTNRSLTHFPDILPDVHFGPKMISTGSLHKAQIETRQSKHETCANSPTCSTTTKKHYADCTSTSELVPHQFIPALYLVNSKSPPSSSLFRAQTQSMLSNPESSPSSMHSATSNSDAPTTRRSNIAPAKADLPACALSSDLSQLLVRDAIMVQSRDTHVIESLHMIDTEPGGATCQEEFVQAFGSGFASSRVMVRFVF